MVWHSTGSRKLALFVQDWARFILGCVELTVTIIPHGISLFPIIHVLFSESSEWNALEKVGCLMNTKAVELHDFPNCT